MVECQDQYSNSRTFNVLSCRLTTPAEASWRGWPSFEKSVRGFKGNPDERTNADVFGRMSRKGQGKLTFPRQVQHYTFGELSLCEVISLRISMLATDARSDCECNITPNSGEPKPGATLLFSTECHSGRNRIAY